jgi:hypothetical protein
MGQLVLGWVSMGWNSARLGWVDKSTTHFSIGTSQLYAGLRRKAVQGIVRRHTITVCHCHCSALYSLLLMRSYSSSHFIPIRRRRYERESVPSEMIENIYLSYVRRHFTVAGSGRQRTF